MLEEALTYLNNGFTPIPVKRDKKPKVSWEKYQDEKPTESEIRGWFEHRNGTGIGIITGEASDIVVLDVDDEDAEKELERVCPGIKYHVKTPRGKHAYFRNEFGMRNHAKIGGHSIDIRGEGGYVVGAPSWDIYKQEHGFNDIPLMPKVLKEYILERTRIYGNSSSERTPPLNQTRQPQTELDSSRQSAVFDLSEGSRDNSLFHVANTMVKGGASEDTVRKVLELLGKSCSPEFPGTEINAKIASAFNRKTRIERNLSQEITEWVMLQERDMAFHEVDKELHISTKLDIANRSKIFSRLVKEGVIERVGNKRGNFRRVQDGVDWMDLEDVDTDPLHIRYPFGMEKVLHTPKKSVICVAGEQGVGKTAYLLNCALLNRKSDMPVTYLTSEAGPQALRVRLHNHQDKLDIADIQKDIRFGAKVSDFHAAIDPNGISIIDYLEVHDSFYMVDQYLTDLFNKLENGIVICGLQKNPNSNLGLGGGFSMQKPEIYLVIEDNYPEGAVMTLKKGRWWTKGESQIGLKMRYRTFGGINLSATQKDWA